MMWGEMEEEEQEEQGPFRRLPKMGGGGGGGREREVALTLSSLFLLFGVVPARPVLLPCMAEYCIHALTLPASSSASGDGGCPDPSSSSSLSQINLPPFQEGGREGGAQKKRATNSSRLAFCCLACLALHCASAAMSRK